MTPRDDSAKRITSRFEGVIERAWKEALNHHKGQFTQTQEAVTAFAAPQDQQKLTLTLGEYSETWNQALFDAADRSFIAGTVAGLRLGFKLAALQAMGWDPTTNTGDWALPGIPKDSFSLFVSLAMVDDLHAKELAAALIEEENGEV